MRGKDREVLKTSGTYTWPYYSVDVKQQLTNQFDKCKRHNSVVENLELSEELTVILYTFKCICFFMSNHLSNSLHATCNHP